MKVNAQELFSQIKKGKTHYEEDHHGVLLLKVFSDYSKGSISAFCCEAWIPEHTFWDWVRAHDVFFECYAMGKMIARENWEEEGRQIAEMQLMPGMNSSRSDVWKMRGWSQFGIGKVNKIRLKIDPEATPNQHYHQLIRQASEGDFTAGEIKQLMEAINVGLNAHQVIKLQEEIDRLKEDLALMRENSDGNNSSPIKGTA
jgi:hypothetical protein